jgi:NADH-quinone oxidoreductase subunit L
MPVVMWMIPVFPALGFLVLGTVGRRLTARAAGVIGTCSVALSMAAVAAVAVQYLSRAIPQDLTATVLWRWMEASGLSIRFGLHLDSLSLLWAMVVTGVGFLIHLYSTTFMSGQEGYARFFSYLNLFVASMLILVLADSLLLLYVGWEGVGLCSFLLIGFWYREPANTQAAVKAFVVTRIGDTALIVGILLLYTRLGTSSIQKLLSTAVSQLPPGAPLAVAAASLVLAGAVGKSAQVPLQTWLPDAMAGPTPVSALIHAATMVTAGVYLIARMNALFALAPNVRFLVAVIGAATLLLAGFSAAVQRDIKRILAYSTISQIGYMFLALGVGAWPAAAFHFLTHACFKALLFLGAGVVILYLEEEHDIFRMGGLWRRMPLVFWTFLVGALSMAAIPPLTAGFYSKDWILYWVWHSGRSGELLWLLAILGVVLTSLYTFRLVFIVFLGPERSRPTGRPGAAMAIPLLVLAVPAALAGFLETPSHLGDIRVFSRFLADTATVMQPRASTPGIVLRLISLSEAASLLGLGLAYLVFRRRLRLGDTAESLPAGALLRRFWLSGWGFDWLYEHALVRPYRWLSAGVGAEPLNWLYRGIGGLTVAVHRLLSATQDGRIRRYAAGVALGAALILALVVVLL